MAGAIHDGDDATLAEAADPVEIATHHVAGSPADGDIVEHAVQGVAVGQQRGLDATGVANAFVDMAVDLVQLGMGFVELGQGALDALFLAGQFQGAVLDPLLQGTGKLGQFTLSRIPGVKAGLEGGQQAVHGADQQAQFIAVMAARTIQRGMAGTDRVHLADAGGQTQQRAGDHQGKGGDDQQADADHPGHGGGQRQSDAVEEARSDGDGIEGDRQLADGLVDARRRAMGQGQAEFGGIGKKLVGQPRQRAFGGGPILVAHKVTEIVPQRGAAHRLILEQATDQILGQLGVHLVGGFRGRPFNHRQELPGGGTDAVPLRAQVAGHLDSCGNEADDDGDYRYRTGLLINQPPEHLASPGSTTL